MGKDAPVIDRVLRSNWWKGKGPPPNGEQKAKDATKVLHDIRKEITGRLTPGLEADSSSSDDEPARYKAKVKAKKEGFFSAFFKKKATEDEGDELLAGSCLDQPGPSGKSLRAKSFLAATMQRDAGVLSGAGNPEPSFGRASLGHALSSSQEWPGSPAMPGPGRQTTSTNDLTLPRIRSVAPSVTPASPMTVPRVHQLRASVDIPSSPLNCGSGAASPGAGTSPFTSRQSSGTLPNSGALTARVRPDPLAPNTLLPPLAADGPDAEGSLSLFERQGTRDSALLCPGSVDRLGHAAFLLAVPAPLAHPAAPGHLTSSPLASGSQGLSAVGLSGSLGLSAVGLNGNQGLDVLGQRSLPGTSTGSPMVRASLSQNLARTRVEPLAMSGRTTSGVGLTALPSRELLSPMSSIKRMALAHISGGTDLFMPQDLDLDDAQSIASTACTSTSKGRGPRPRNLIAAALAPPVPPPARRRSVVCATPVEEPLSADVLLLSPTPPTKPAAHGRRRPVVRHDTAPQLATLARLASSVAGELSPASSVSNVVQSPLSPCVSTTLGAGGAGSCADPLPAATPLGVGGSNVPRGAGAGLVHREGGAAADLGSGAEWGEVGAGGTSRADEKIKQLWQVQDKTAAEVARLAAAEEKHRREEAAVPTPKWTNGQTAYRHRHVARELGASVAVNALAEYDQPRFKASRAAVSGPHL